MIHSISLQSRLFIGAVALLLETGIIWALHRKKIREEQALWWFAVGLGIIVLVGSARVFQWVTQLVGAEHPALTLTLLALIFVLFMLVYFSLKTARLEDKINRLTRQLTLLDHQRPKDK